MRLTIRAEREKALFPPLVLGDYNSGCLLLPALDGSLFRPTLSPHHIPAYPCSNFSLIHLFCQTWKPAVAAPVRES